MIKKTKNTSDSPKGPQPTKPLSFKNLETLVRTGATIAVLARLLAFEGPVKGGAPVLVDFELEKEGTLQLDIWTKDATEPATLTFDGKTGEETLEKNRKLPDQLGKKWQPAELSVSAVDKSGKEIDFCLFGIGVGKHAVKGGSAAIEQVTFGPGKIRGDESARWGFRAKRDFERAGIEIYRLEMGDRCSKTSPVQTFSPPCVPERGERCQGVWAGNNQEGIRSEGRHRVLVKAWRSEAERDWIFKVSEEEVTVD